MRKRRLYGLSKRGGAKDFYGYAQIHSSEYGKAVSAGKLKRVKGEIASFRAGGVTTAGGGDLDADVVVY